MPPNVIHASEDTSLVEMMAKGEISAGFSGNAGLGRAGKPTAGWDAKKIPPADYPDLFPDAKSLEAAWFKKTGIYPMHGTIVVKDSVLREHPWVARSLHDAYSAAKQEWLAALRVRLRRFRQRQEVSRADAGRRRRSPALRHRSATAPPSRRWKATHSSSN